MPATSNNGPRSKRTAISLLIGCVVFAANPATAQPEAGADDFQKVMETATTCFTGAWASPEAYVAAVGGDERERAKAKQHYVDMRETYECRWFDYSVDGYKVRGFYAKPKVSDSSTLPVIIYNRGGNADMGVIPVPWIIGKLFPVVKEGFVVTGSMYRGASLDGTPHPDRLADEFGGQDVNDVLALLPIIDDMPFADGDRLGIWGNSRGGMIHTSRRGIPIYSLHWLQNPPRLISKWS